MRFVNRERELKFLKAYLNTEPNAITFIYGPKSSGKSVLMREVIKSLSKKEFSIFWFDLRETLISSYDSVIDLFFLEEELEGGKELDLNLEAGIFNFIRIKSAIKREIKDKRLDPFRYMAARLRKFKGKKVIIFDELQKLKEVYLNSPVNQRPLINELFNFFVRLTKVEHLSHVFVLSSDTFFIEEIYANSSLAKCSKYYLVDDPEEKPVRKYLKEEGFTPKETDYIIKHAGTLLWAINQVIEDKKSGVSIRESVEALIKDSWAKISLFLDSQPKDKREEYQKILSDLLSGEKILNPDLYNLKLVKELFKREFIFFNPLEKSIRLRSKIEEHAVRRILK